MMHPAIKFLVGILAYAVGVVVLSFVGYWIEDLLDRLGERLFPPKDN